MESPDYSTYVINRFTGFEGEPTPPNSSRDMLDFPEYAPFRRTGFNQPTRPKCNGPIAWKDFEAVQRDIDNLKAAASHAEVFMTAVSPGQVARFQGNVYYKSDEYLWALADVLKGVQGDHRRWFHAASLTAQTWPLAGMGNSDPDVGGVSQGGRHAP